MINTEILIWSLVGILAILLIFYIVGYVINDILVSNHRTSPWLDVYIRLVVGMIFVISTYAIIKTQGLTIMLPLPLLAFILLRTFNTEKIPAGESRNKTLKITGLFLLSATVFYLLYYALSFLPDREMMYYPFSDIPFYARIAENLNIFGKENMRVEYLFPERYSTEPYHYGDIWIIAFSSFLLGMKPVHSVLFVTYPLMISIFSLGVAAFLELAIKNKKYKNAILFVALFAGMIGGYKILMPVFLFSGHVDSYTYSLANYPKLLWFACMIPLMFIFAYYKKYIPLFCISLIIGLSFINVMPTILLGTVGWILICSYKEKQHIKNVKWLLLISLPVLFFVYLLYTTNDAKDVVPALRNSYSVNDGKIALNIFIGSMLQTATYIPAFLLFILFLIITRHNILKDKIIFPLSLGCMLAVSGMFTWALLFKTTAESVQFFHNVFTVVCGLMSFFMFIYILAFSQKWYLTISALTLLLISIFIHAKYDFQIRNLPKNEYADLLKFTDIERPVFAHYMPDSDYTKNHFSSNTIVAAPYICLIEKIPQYQNHSLNITFAHFDTASPNYPFIKTQVDWAPMTYYIHKRQLENVYPDSVMRQFMVDYKIPFLCAPINTSVPDLLADLITDSLYTPGMGWKIYKCNTQ